MGDPKYLGGVVKEERVDIGRHMEDHKHESICTLRYRAHQGIPWRFICKIQALLEGLKGDVRKVNVCECVKHVSGDSI